MRNHLGYLILIALFGAACATAAGTLDARKHYWEKRLGRELPAGSDLPTVQKYFGSAHLEQHYDSKSNTLEALERNVSHSLLASCDITITCTFDGQALQKCVV